MTALASYLADHSLSDLARRLGVSHTTIMRWRDQRVPAEHISALMDATGLTAAQIRPDLALLFERPATHGRTKTVRPASNERAKKFSR